MSAETKHQLEDRRKPSSRLARGCRGAAVLEEGGGPVPAAPRVPAQAPRPLSKVLAQGLVQTRSPEPGCLPLCAGSFLSFAKGNPLVCCRRQGGRG